MTPIHIASLKARFHLRLGLILLAALSVWATRTFAEASSALRPIDLRCEYLKNPLGIDTPQPRLSWVLESPPAARNQRQTAWQILVASTARQLAAGAGDLWNSEKTNSDQSVQVKYGGQLLLSEQSCFWKVRVWDQDGKPSPWSHPARWTMGVLSRSDWQGNWIGFDEPGKALGPPNPLAGAQWIWYPEGHPETAAPVGTRYFRRLINLPGDRTIKRATLLFTADNNATFWVNGQTAGTAGDFHSAAQVDLTRLLRAGKNVLAVTAINAGSDPNPAGLIARLQVEFAQGEPIVVGTDSDWMAAQRESPNWQTVEGEGSEWVKAQELGPPGMQPWGTVTGPEDRRLPARLLRRQFSIEKRIERATAHICGVGLFELYLNGEKIGDQVLAPALTDYTKRALYLTFDVTRYVKKGNNAVGVILGNGRFYAPRSRVPTETVSYGYPKLRFQMRVEYKDGTWDDVLSDGAWNFTTDGPIQANNEYDGEEYDARREIADWSRPGFDDSHWRRVLMVAPPGGIMAAQMMEPIRVTETRKPISLNEPQPGVYIFDLGQNMVGWCRLRVSGPSGTAVSLRHAETLKADGTLYLDNIRSAKVTDSYTLKGKGLEVYEPRFTYHGFRYVELTGFPGKPNLSTIEGRVVNDDVPSAGEFTCSNPLLNHIYENIRWGVRGNYRSIPTDCPQRDERQGWLGDRSAESKGETYLFHTAALYAKWLQDMADAQKPNGSVPDVCPAYWPIYSDNVTWPSSTVIIPGTLRDQFGDAAVLENHYSSARKWVEHMNGYLADGIISRDSYGDWCVPPEDQKLIHSNDPKRKTNPALIATAYFYADLRLMAQYATLIGKTGEAQFYAGEADQLKAAFNRKFLNSEAGQYDNGSQTSCVLPLAFNLVPEELHARVFGHLVSKINQESHDHIGTGLIGCQWLMRVLTDNGRADLAYTLAAQTTYPSWGYMVNQGATTIWELWNGNTADPAMNSGNHVMLVGDLGIWLYESLAGIKPDPEQPGFKRIIMRPEPVGDLRFAKATHHSPYGLIASHWQRAGDLFQWDITVPVNSTASVCVPAKDPAAVTESGRTATQVPGLKFDRMENGRAVFSLGSGTYHFQSRD